MVVIYFRIVIHTVLVKLVSNISNIQKEEVYILYISRYVPIPLT